MKRVTVLSLVLGLGMLGGGNIASAAICGSVSLTSSLAIENTGAISCVAWGDDNLKLKNGQIDATGLQVGAIPTFDPSATSVSGINFNVNTGEFTINDSVWTLWEKIFIGLKQGNGNAGGGWGLFSLTSIIVSGEFETKLQGNGGTGLSHSFYVGGVPVGGNVPEVPVPAAVWLFGSGLLGLLGAARKKSESA